jgi:GNAT superfamily N-acetyltransferase
LAALRDAPQAFSATLDSTLARGDPEWEQMLYQRIQFVAQVGDEVVGTVGAVASATDGVADLISMWVAPDWRRRGIGRQLIAAILLWAPAEGFSEVRLWVVDDNDVAEKAYASSGFTRTGSIQPVRPGEPQHEFEMARRL